MAVTQQQVMDALADVPLPAGGSLGSADAVRALQIDDGNVRFVLELPDATGAASDYPIFGGAGVTFRPRHLRYLAATARVGPRLPS